MIFYLIICWNIRQNWKKNYLKHSGDEAQIESLLKSGVNPNSVNEYEIPILSYAAALGTLRISNSISKYQH